jgi:hypothetical protein
MNIFGAFTFGSLIKTFLPGFVWLIAIVVLFWDFSDTLGLPPELWPQLLTKDQALIVLAIPGSILLGLLSNILVFMGLNDRLVRSPMHRKYAALYGLLEELKRRVREQCWDRLAPQTNLDRTLFFSDTIDPEIILLERMGVEKLAYVREQYWYHLEFQLNLMLSLIVLFLALIIATIIRIGFCAGIGYIVLCAVLGCVFSIWLLTSARKNYCRHLAKMASLMTALLSAPPKPPEK